MLQKEEDLWVVDSWLPSFDYYYVFWPVKSCSTSQGVFKVSKQLDLHKAFESTQTLAWVPKVYEHFHTQLLDIPNHT